MICKQCDIHVCFGRLCSLNFGVSRPVKERLCSIPACCGAVCILCVCERTFELCNEKRAKLVRFSIFFIIACAVFLSLVTYIESVTSWFVSATVCVSEPLSDVKERESTLSDSDF